MITQHDRIILTRGRLPAVEIPAASERLDLLQQVCPKDGSEASVSINNNFVRISATGLDAIESPIEVSCSMLNAGRDQGHLLLMNFVLHGDGNLKEAKFGVPSVPVNLENESERSQVEGPINTVFTHLKTALEFGSDHS